MLEEPPVFCRQNRLDDVVGYLVDRHGVTLDDAALSDLVAVAVEEGNRVIPLAAPVLGSFLEGGQREREHDDRAQRAERESFAAKLDERAPPAGYPEAAEEDGDVFPGLARLEACFVKAGIDPSVDGEQTRCPRGLRFSRLERIFHYTHATRSTPPCPSVARSAGSLRRVNLRLFLPISIPGTRTSPINRW